jgi:hypothetical protein
MLLPSLNPYQHPFDVAVKTRATMVVSIYQGGNDCLIEIKLSPLFSSASRFTVGASGFFVLIQSRECLDRLLEGGVEHDPPATDLPGRKFAPRAARGFLYFFSNVYQMIAAGGFSR